MTFFLLPRTVCPIYENILCDTSNGENETCALSQSLCSYLSKIKEKITVNEKQWDTYKKYTNPYEYIHSYIPHHQESICKHSPLSRSYFKMIEMMYAFAQLKSYIRIGEDKKKREAIKSFHIAEGPGGFIEALVYLRKCPQDTYYGMTLLDENKQNTNIPAWKKSESFLHKHKNVVLENGVDQTGNILSLDNFEYVVKKYGSTMDIVTADGGFDFSIDFNKQELLISQLLFAQIAYAVCIQKKGGTFILKLFDCFMSHTVDLVYLLTSFYESVHVMKPQTSRYANSEKYIVCSGFVYDGDSEYYNHIFKCFEGMLNSAEYPRRFLKGPIPSLFMKKMDECNIIFGQQQTQNIHHTLSLLESKPRFDQIETLVKANMKRATDWCIKHHLPYNIIHSYNMFLTPKKMAINDDD